jgi:hypothetical protein
MARDELASFNYLIWNEKYRKEKPYELILDLPLDSPVEARTNIKFGAGPEEQIHDLRGKESTLSLDGTGFIYRHIQPDSSEANFNDRHWVEKTYMPNVVEPFLRKHVHGADRIFFFDWHVSRIKIMDWP